MHSVAEEMGAALRRTAISPNIKERRDYSCAVFDAEGRVLAMGDHMPVHLGSMPASVAAALERLTLGPGDLAVLNDPYAGGTHLPDITMVLPVFLAEAAKPLFYVATRAHHADVGGMYPGSMGPAREIFQEGLRIPPVRLMRNGAIDEDVLSLILLNVRTPTEREGDLHAQIGACRVGETRMLALAARLGTDRVKALGDALLDYSEDLVRAQLRTVPAGEFSAEDFLDDDGVVNKPIRIAVTLRVNPVAASIEADFTASDPQVQGSVNAVRSITLSACFYVLRCLLAGDAPSTAGILRPLTLLTTPGTIVDARPPAPVAGGNVETSQRMVDVLLRTLAQALPDRVLAGSAGTMSNLTLGGIDRRTGRPFTYYETTAGGMGARPASARGLPGMDGLSGVQTHMTNSLNTPVEALEFAYPVRVRRYGYRANSGGAGKHRGGDGLIRELELLSASEVTLLADRRTRGAYGLAGGAEGAVGRATLTTPNGQTKELPGKGSTRAEAGSILRLETPGGGGWGSV